MKSLLTLCLLLVSLCADAAFYQYQRFTTNFDTTLVNGDTLTNLLGTSLAVSTVNSNSFDPPTLALLSSIGGTTPSVIYTNFISGRAYTNTSGRPIMVNAQIALTVAVISGAAEMGLYVDATGGTTWPKTNLITIGTTASTASDSYILQLSGFVPIGGSYILTNTSRGTGNSATTISTASSPNIVQY